jgi:hypothetical protein
MKDDVAELARVRGIAEQARILANSATPPAILIRVRYGNPLTAWQGSLSDAYWAANRDCWNKESRDAVRDEKTLLRDARPLALRRCRRRGRLLVFTSRYRRRPSSGR